MKYLFYALGLLTGVMGLAIILDDQSMLGVLYMIKMWIIFIYAEICDRRS